jgi:peptidoglycan/xylan/chitin deacetylase (PgdA/CDA1 family)
VLGLGAFLAACGGAGGAKRTRDGAGGGPAEQVLTLRVGTAPGRIEIDRKRLTAHAARKARSAVTRLLAVAGLCAALVACGASGDAAPARTPAPAPRVALSAEDRRAWAPRPVEDAAVRVLLYRDVAPREFARQLVLLHHAGYRTIGLDELVRFVEREPVSLPPRPLLLTFDGGRLETWTGSDAILRELGFSAVMFVDAGRVLADDPAYLTWGELASLQRSGRWDVQLQSGTGNRLIKYGPGRDDVGPFYAYRGSEEVLGGWRERVFSDITDAEELLVRRVPGYRPLAFAPPYGNYGQAGTNDPRIPRELLARLEMSFRLVFSQDHGGFARPGARNPIGRIEVSGNTAEEALLARLSYPRRHTDNTGG